MDEYFKNYIRQLNKGFKGEIIYTGDPDFNDTYRAKRSTLYHWFKNPKLFKLATREQELQAKVDWLEMLAKVSTPHLKKYFDHKQIRRRNATKPRKMKPTKDQLIIYRDKYFYDQGKLRGWLKAAAREFGLSTSTISSIINE